MNAPRKQESGNGLLDYLSERHPRLSFIRLHYDDHDGNTDEHLHKDLYQITCCTYGNGFVRIGPREFRPDEYCFYLINPNELHALGPLPGERFQNITCRFELPGFSGRLLQGEIRLAPDETAEAQAILCRVQAHAHRGGEAELIRAGLLLAELLLLLEQSSGNGDGGGKFSPLVNKAIAFIEENFRSGNGIDAVASACDVSASHLSRVFHKETGLTPLAYLHRVRLGFALERLFRTRMKVSEIAVESGFENSKNLNQAFQRVYNMSPTEFRIRHQEEPIAP